MTASTTKSGRQLDRLAELEEERRYLLRSLQDLEREREAGDLAARPPASEASSVSQGFWKDIVSDKTGRVALDRLQMVVWSVLLGGLYLHSVLVYVTMPDFSATLLGLMGLSSGTYVGFKMPARGQ